jgi:hypothetical protein
VLSWNNPDANVSIFTVWHMSYTSSHEIQVSVKKQKKNERFDARIKFVHPIDKIKAKHEWSFTKNQWLGIFRGKWKKKEVQYSQLFGISIFKGK